MHLIWLLFPTVGKPMNRPLSYIQLNSSRPYVNLSMNKSQKQPQLIFLAYLKGQSMFKPAAIFIGLRYTRAKRRNHFISFITLTSMLGIALGVMALITVLSVMNGFDREIKKRVFSMVPPVTVSSLSGYLAEWNNLQKILKNIPGVVNTAPYVTGEALLTFGSFVAPALVNGILPEQEKNITALSEKIVQGNLALLK